jgi:hypothetical protein
MRTCLACASQYRQEIDQALATGVPLRSIAERVSISATALHRHKYRVRQEIVKASERREERLGDNLLDDMRRVQAKAWQLLGNCESDGDHRGSIVALREVRECLESLGTMLAKAKAESDLPNSHHPMKLELLSNDELEMLSKLILKASPDLQPRWE